MKRQGGTKVPMKLLARLCAAEGPTEVFDQDEIEKLAVLRSTALVEADIPALLVEA